MATRMGNQTREKLTTMEYVNYDHQELVDNVYLTITNLRGRYLSHPRINHVDIGLQLVDGTYFIHTSCSDGWQNELPTSLPNESSPMPGSWGYGSFDTRFPDEDFVIPDIFKKTAEAIVNEALSDYQLEHYSESKRNGI